MLFRHLASFIILCLLTFSSIYSYAAPFQEETEKKEPTKEEAENKAAEPNKVAIIKRPEIFAPVDSLKQKEQDLTHYLKAEKVVPMLAGAKDFITIINENTSSNQKGVMILLPDWEMTATSSKALNYLQKMLPSQGWTTIAIQPPSRPIGYPSSALNFSQQVEENGKLLAQCQDNITAMMTAVMEKAKNYPGIFVVVSKGSHAVLLANLYSNGKLEPPSAMVMLSGYMNTGAESLSFAKTLATSEFPVLDLFLSRDHQLATTDASIRKAQATKEMKVYYRQTQLYNNQIGFYPEKKLLRSINGWLKSIGW
ncbi:MAG: DUF3530 family protein [Colwellia sp.]|nr:DUF3530 family protein [Colwellia sp.]